MNSNNDQENETQKMKSEFNELSTSNLGSVNNKNCSYCNNPFTAEELCCKNCGLYNIMEGWSSENSDIDKFIKDTMYNEIEKARHRIYCQFKCLEWVPFGRFTNIKKIGEGGFAKVYSAMWNDGRLNYEKYCDWKKLDSKPIKVALKRLNGSQNISTDYLNGLKMDYDLLKFYGITKDPITNEFMTILRFAERGNLRDILSNNFNNMFWKEKINLLCNLSTYLKNSHEMGYIHKNFHSGNVFYNSSCKRYYIADYGIYGSASEQNSNNKIYGVLPYIAPEVLNGKPYTLSSDVYSFGIIMTELSSGKPPFYDKEHNAGLGLDICKGLRPEFGEDTPEIYKKLASRCMNANSNQRPTAIQLNKMLEFWKNSIDGKTYGYKEEKIKTAFENADIEIRDISIEKNPDAVYTSRIFTFSELSEPINSYYFDHKSCSYCGKSFIEEFWCEECDPYNIMEGWNSGDPNVDKFIKDTMYNASQKSQNKFLEWIPFDRFIDIELIGKGEYTEVYSATWIDGRSHYYKLDGNWRKSGSGHTRVVLKKLNSSQNISIKYLNELKKYYELNKSGLNFYGMSKNPKTEEFLLITEFANNGNLRNILSSNFNNIFWNDKIKLLYNLAIDLKNLHERKYFHKNLHSGNILQIHNGYTLRDSYNSGTFHNIIYGVLPYIAPEVLNGESYTSLSDIYSFGIIMVELSSGKPPFYDRKHDSDLALDICKGLRPEFGKGTPEIYKKLAYRCMSVNLDHRPTANELYSILNDWHNYEIVGYKRKITKLMFEEADKEIPNISSLYSKNSGAICTSRKFTFSNMPKPVNSSIIASYLKDLPRELIDYKKISNNCSRCNKPFIEESWCKTCDPYCMINGWTSGSLEVDEFISNTIYKAGSESNSTFIEWVPFDRFANKELIGEGGFAQVYSATWIDGKSKYEKQNDENWIKLNFVPKKVVLKKLNESQDISAKFLNELKTHWKLNAKSYDSTLKFYGMTMDPETKEFMMIIEFANKGSLSNILSKNFSNLLWKDKIKLLYFVTIDLKNLHELGYLHMDLHSGNILQNGEASYISDFGLSGPAGKQESRDKLYGVLPYIAPEVLNGAPYTFSSDIYSFGIIMTELSSGKPPFHSRKHDFSLALEICKGTRPEFGKDTPEIYKKLAYRCMNANSIQRPTVIELNEILKFWYISTNQNIMGDNEEKIRAIFEEADKKIPNVSISYEKDTKYVSRALSFDNLPKPINSPNITSYLNSEGLYRLI
ncbi:kinase-like protein [Rhizophagus irregularis]|uniref:Kinase-like protein n=1 Tax=Rhizophagus irregularis TaxID=588596 RepID=A0A2N0PFK8_9GLOM|nr:kinase-like protein [Rhizophagus irregularis]